MLSSDFPERPDAKKGEVVCDGCWKLQKLDKAVEKWKIYTFKHLKPQLLCQECQMRDQKNLAILQGSGL